MTPEALSEAFPEIIKCDYTGIETRKPGTWLFWEGGNWNECFQNNPLSDLNAIHAAEAEIFPRLISETAFELKAWFDTPLQNIPASINREQVLKEKEQFNAERKNRNRIQLWKRYERLLGIFGNRIHALADQRAKALLSVVEPHNIET